MGRDWQYREQPGWMVRLRRTTSVVIVIAVASLAGLGGSQTQAATPTTPVTIGAVFSLTGGGDVYGPQQAKAAQLAVAQINAAGGDRRRAGSAGRRLTTNPSPSVGKAAMRQLIQQDGAVAVLGPTPLARCGRGRPDRRLAARRQSSRSATPRTASSASARTPAPGSGAIASASRSPCPRTSPSTVEAHPSTAAILYVSGDILGERRAEIAAASFAQNDVRVVRGLRVPPTGSVAAAVRQALAKKPGVVFIGASVRSARRRCDERGARGQGYTGTFLGGNTLQQRRDGGARRRSRRGRPQRSAWYSGNDFPANTSFETAYQQRYGEPADQFAAQSYIGVQILADALGRGAGARARSRSPRGGRCFRARLRTWR